MFPIRNFAVDIGLKLDRWPIVRGWEQLSCDACIQFFWLWYGCFINVLAAVICGH